MTKSITNSEDIIDVRDVIERFEELEAMQQDEIKDADNSSYEEYDTLKDLLEILKSTGGDEKWRGDWYPITLIRESYFVSYAQELAEGCGYLEKNPGWPNTCIDWEFAAKELQYDYSSCELDGITYYYR